MCPLMPTAFTAEPGPVAFRCFALREVLGAGAELVFGASSGGTHGVPVQRRPPLTKNGGT